MYNVGLEAKRICDTMQAVACEIRRQNKKGGAIVKSRMTYVKYNGSHGRMTVSSNKGTQYTYGNVSPYQLRKVRGMLAIHKPGRAWNYLKNKHSLVEIKRLNDAAPLEMNPQNN